ncbi:hypothetical protein [Noviherbaspirillum pedocola]|uniref:Uncharacterized protein n=1 Tax=Noviherbaspirillum pedocola TaxID=2801341 RepID=A0A934SW02_9BURK|nr:hypothetical protein [Noviherbaspirillum pedocola]MBK4736624.1 hypothetical protein [Noviherbaspirillum pedocola]
MPLDQCGGQTATPGNDLSITRGFLLVDRNEINLISRYRAKEESNNEIGIHQACNCIAIEADFPAADKYRPVLMQAVRAIFRSDSVNFDYQGDMAVA